MYFKELFTIKMIARNIKVSKVERTLAELPLSEFLTYRYSMTDFVVDVVLVKTPDSLELPPPVRSPSVTSPFSFPVPEMP